MELSKLDSKTLDKVRDETNLILFERFGCGIEDLKLSNEIIDSLKE